MEGGGAELEVKEYHHVLLPHDYCGLVTAKAQDC